MGSATLEGRFLGCATGFSGSLTGGDLSRVPQLGSGCRLAGTAFRGLDSRALTGTVLLALGSIAAPLIAVQLMTAAAWRTLVGSPRFPWKQLALVTVLVIAFLSVCPEWPIYSGSVTAHVLTVACGAMVVLVPMRFLVSEMGTDPNVRIAPSLTRGEWVVVTAGVFFGAIGFWSTTSTEQRMFPHLGLPATVVAALLLAYAFLGRPLGLLRSETRGA